MQQPHALAQQQVQLQQHALPPGLPPGAQQLLQDTASAASNPLQPPGAPFDAAALVAGGLFPGWTDAAYELSIVKARLRQLTTNMHPSIYQRRTTDLAQELGVRVAEWSSVKKGGRRVLGRTARRANSLDGSRGSLPKLSRAVKAKASGTGRTYTSKFRGVHQTFPTKRWEAQFRRNGKPTSLGCFDREEEAARAYDKMMLWCELHNTTGVKGGITNFDALEYEKDMALLSRCLQDELIDALRGEGRKQAAQRMHKNRRDGSGMSGDDTDNEPGSVVDGDERPPDMD